MDIENFLKTFVPTIDKEIKKVIQSSKFPNLYNGVDYAIFTGGKRLRPILCLAVCKILGGDIKKALPFATSIELVHKSTLVHDDIEDGDKVRGGSLSVWKKYGLAHGINIGDGMIFKAYECLLNSKKFLSFEKSLKLVDMFTDTMMRVIEGQNMEFNFRGRENVSISEYVEMVSKKTGMLFSLTLSGGAFIANASERTQKSLMEYGKKIGVAFQIRDDILNLTGQKKYGKEIYGDIKEGKRTLILIHCLENCNKIEKKSVLEILKKPREKVNSNDTNLIINLIKKYDSIQFADNYSQNLIEEAKKHLKAINNRELEKILLGFSDFMIKREY